MHKLRRFGFNAATVDVVAVCNPRLLGQLKDYIEGWQPPKEEWE